MPFPVSVLVYIHIFMFSYLITCHVSCHFSVNFDTSHSWCQDQTALAQFAAVLQTASKLTDGHNQALEHNSNVSYHTELTNNHHHLKFLIHQLCLVRCLQSLYAAVLYLQQCIASLLFVVLPLLRCLLASAVNCF